MTYDYRVTDVIRVVDGDTIDLRIDLGFHLTAALRFRVLGLNTPERGHPLWGAATDITATWLNDHAGNLYATTRKADSFGRWLADIRAPLADEWLTDHVVATMRDEHGYDARWTR